MNPLGYFWSRICSLNVFMDGSWKCFCRFKKIAVETRAFLNSEGSLPAVNTTGNDPSNAVPLSPLIVNFVSTGLYPSFSC